MKTAEFMMTNEIALNYINELAYKLYDLTEEEIKMIENN